VAAGTRKGRERVAKLVDGASTSVARPPPASRSLPRAWGRTAGCRSPTVERIGRGNRSRGELPLLILVSIVGSIVLECSLVDLALLPGLSKNIFGGTVLETVQ